MRVFSREEVAAKAPYGEVIEALRQAFRSEIVAPPRHHHLVARAGGASASLLLMPSWTHASAETPARGAYAGLKTVMVIADNADRGRPTVQANYLLLSAETGETLAVMDGVEITLRRTAAAAALAADYLARNDAQTLLMVGAGALARHVVRAHAVLRPISRVAVWNRSPGKADRLCAALREEGFDASVPASVEAACATSDIVSCATASKGAIVRGVWLAAGTHIDLMGAFTPEMRESDGHAVARSRVYVDTVEGARSEAGDLLQAVREGCFRMTDIVGDLSRLCRGEVAGRGAASEITLFKSCGTAIEDLATAILVYEK